MAKGAIFKTFVSRFLILILNFGLVIYSTNTWGSEGKGVISIVIADLTIVSFMANIFVGSSMSYFASKYKTEEIIPFAYIWSIIIGVLLPFALSFHHGVEYSNYLIFLSVFSSLLAANVNLFIGQKNIKMFNMYTVLQQLVHIVFILGIVYIFKITSVDSYFIAQIFCFALLFVISTFQVLKKCNVKKISFSKQIGYRLFDYGWKTQLSSFLQFLNNRLSFYFLEYFKGIVSVGIFSIGIAFSEAIWTVSRSLSVVLYADIVNRQNTNAAIEKTKVSLRVSFLITLFFIVLMLLIPGKVYSMIFGKDFSNTKEIILFLSPGILAIAVSNIIGYYFAGINKLRILNTKSLIGLVFTIISSLFVIPRWGILGACIITSISYCLSSSLLFWKFYQDTEFHFRDFILSKSEINLLLNKAFRKK
ncbi:polysaccharide biosynthesis C-terminal domain-containing protein [Chryseobacterium sp. Ch-15]|uniref:Polysaccharide biosynthesis C-terminal domain-containing protein n=1 Tax=Chryseobacterium muglaense TaxID=2893752 RepID=A0A9Q3UUL6_9FLAO|nr:polysaccharide biosynthesis C-terminal domain-containing protein [Chryseobacterium muglaense]MBD3904250.1 polysaccharide biosynthesis C-terminal domain-containing protein [Chryseobacterium muglaense]MCC9035434.1 polysaccharide biosynthesis C-terminal domain-containing protein [Chryseobacterium muglaense]MCM2553901.1 polysaccharide biosynthesis C-terminal domain-containing protein [Chryseobacterium muglaense]